MNARRFRRWTGAYRKEFYEVRLKSGDIIECWPNAGRMVALDGSGREFKPEDKVAVRLKEEDYGE